MIEPIGYFKVHRVLFSKPIWKLSTPQQKTILITLIAMAGFQPNEWEFKGKKYTAKAGEFITSINSIVENCGKGVTSQNVRTALARFEKLGFLTNESTNKNRRITIVNWEQYQSRNEKLTKQPTSNQQATNKQLTNNLTTIEEVKKDLNDINVNQSFISDDGDFKAIAQNFQKKIGILNATNMQKLSQDFEKYGKYVLWHAVEIGSLKNATSYKYIEKLLTDWDKRGLKDIESINEYLNNRYVNKKANYHNEPLDYDSYYK